MRIFIAAQELTDRANIKRTSRSTVIKAAQRDIHIGVTKRYNGGESSHFQSLADRSLRSRLQNNLGHVRSPSKVGLVITNTRSRINISRVGIDKECHTSNRSFNGIANPTHNVRGELHVVRAVADTMNSEIPQGSKNSTISFIHSNDTDIGINGVSLQVGRYLGSSIDRSIG